jgi:rhodanese-related sulfurtransferase
METPPLNVEQIPDIVWIDTAQLTVQLAAEEIPIFDMRDYVDYAVARIANAMNIPVKYLSKRLDSIPQDVPIVLVFPSEADAIASWELLIRAGYNPELMSVLEGGMEQWTSEGLPTVDSLVGVC